MGDLLLYGGYTSGILAFQDIRKSFGKLHMKLLHKLAVFYKIYGNVAVNISQNIEIQRNIAVDFDYVLLSVFSAGNILEHSDRAVQLVQTQIIVYLPAFSGFNMVSNDT